MKLQIKPNELANYHSNHDHFYILLHKSKHTQMQIKMVNDHIIAQFRIKIYEKKTRVNGMHELKKQENFFISYSTDYFNGENNKIINKTERSIRAKSVHYLKRFDFDRKGSTE